MISSTWTMHLLAVLLVQALTVYAANILINDENNYSINIPVLKSVRDVVASKEDYFWIDFVDIKPEEMDILPEIPRGIGNINLPSTRQPTLEGMFESFSSLNSAVTDCIYAPSQLHYYINETNVNTSARASTAHENKPPLVPSKTCKKTCCTIS